MATMEPTLRGGGTEAATLVAPSSEPRAWTPTSRAQRLRGRTAWLVVSVCVDVTMLLAASVAAIAAGHATGMATPPAKWALAFGCIAIVMYQGRGLYRAPLTLRIIDDLRVLAVATTLAAVIAITLRLVVSPAPHIAAELGRLWAFALVYVSAGRVALAWSQIVERRRGEGCRRTLIVGAGNIGCLTAKRLLEHPEVGLQPVAFLDKEPLEEARSSVGLPVAGASWDLDAAIAEYGIEHIVITFSTAPSDVLLRIMRRCEEMGRTVSVVPRLFESVPERLTIEHLGGVPLITAHHTNPRGAHFAIKYTLDRLVAAFLLLLVLPVLAASALAVRLSLGRPILFRQRRVGRDGRPFDMLKFRTMHGTPEEGGEADAAWMAEQLGADSSAGAVEFESRLTPVGDFLRRTSLDELPQLLNVLVGHMSLVGPRPERTHYVREFERSVYRYGDRHRVRSGITGWAQVNGLRGETSLADRAEWDNWYIENFSLWLDVKILLKTAAALLASFRRAE
jgi:exopolysaccharide biosynthesis polyprenyl glycosylphosphotransferase